jgi:hypothetical protein
MIWIKIKEERWILLFLAVLGIIRAYWHLSWFRPTWTWLPIWDYPFGIKSPPFDTFHVIGGIFAVMIIVGSRLNLRKVMKEPFNVNRKDRNGDYIGVTQVGTKTQANKWWIDVLIVAFEFVWFFFFFGLFYHVIFMLPEHQEWSKAIFFLKWFGL